jgi:hypothetical protein
MNVKKYAVICGDSEDGVVRGSVDTEKRVKVCKCFVSLLM